MGVPARATRLEATRRRRLDTIPYLQIAVNECLHKFDGCPVFGWFDFPLCVFFLHYVRSACLLTVVGHDQAVQLIVSLSISQPFDND